MEYCVVIGSANLDISLSVDQTIIWRDSNIGAIRLTPGGVGRNIAENLGRLNIRTHFITPLGHEPDADLLRKSCTRHGVILHSLSSETLTTSKYAALFDEHNDMLVGVADTMSVEKLTPKDFVGYLDLIRDAAVLILETNLSEAVLKYLSKLNDTVYVNAISTTKAKRIKPLYKDIHTLSLNRLESQALTNNSVSLDALEPLRDFFISKGVQNVLLTVGSEGAYLMNKEAIIKQPATNAKIVNTSGAGDGFLAGYIYGTLKGFNPLHTASALASLSLESDTTVHQSLNETRLKNKLKELSHA